MEEHAAGGRMSRGAATICLLALVVVSLVSRLAGIGSMLPHQPEPDAVIVWQAEWLERAADDPGAQRRAAPPFYPLLLADLARLLPGRSVRAILPAEAPVEAHLAAAARPHVRARVLVLLLSLLAIPAAYRIARAFLARGPALAAAALAATSLLAANYAQQARPHAASAALSAVAVCFALRHVRRGGHASFLAASAAAAVAIAALHNGIFVLPALLLAWWFAPGRRLLQLAWPAACVACVLWRFYPFLFAPGIVVPRGDEISIGGQELAWDRLSPSGFVKIARGFAGFDPVLGLLAAAGAVALAVALGRRSLDRRALAVALAFPATFSLFWGFMVHMFPRFTVPLVPFLAVLAAAGLAGLVHALAPERRRASAFACASLLALLLPAYACLRLSLLRAAPDTFTVAAGWLSEHADPEADLVAHELLALLPLERTRASAELLPRWARGPWEQYQLALEREPPRACWNLVPVFRRGFFEDRILDVGEATTVLRASGATVGIAFTGIGRGAQFDQTREALASLAGAPAWSIEPFDARHAHLNRSGYELGYHGLEQVLRSRVWGPPIDVYTIRREADAPDGAPSAPR